MVTTEHKLGLSYNPVGICGFPFEFMTPFITDGYTICIETGTHHGNTTLYLADLFHSVWTIEFSEEFFSEAKKNLSINLILQQSSEIDESSLVKF